MRLCIVGVAAMAAVATAPVLAQESAPDAATIAAAEANEDYLDRTPVSCISLMRVRDTDVIDDRTILFSLGGGNYYVNVLNQSCFGLGSSDRFMSTTRSNRLCSADMIRPFRQFVSSVIPGVHCRLGDFHPISRAEAEALEMDADELAAAKRSVVLTPLDPVPIDDETDGGSPAGDSQPAPGSPSPDITAGSEDAGP